MKLTTIRIDENRYSVQFANYQPLRGWTQNLGAFNKECAEAQFINNLYMDYFNNFLTVGAFAEYYDITEDDANEVIELGRKRA